MEANAPQPNSTFVRFGSKAGISHCTTDVRYGSKADKPAPAKFDFCPLRSDSGQRRAQSDYALSANTGKFAPRNMEARPVFDTPQLPPNGNCGAVISRAQSHNAATGTALSV
jgi:hypothetical protein